VYMCACICVCICLCACTCDSVCSCVRSCRRCDRTLVSVCSAKRFGVAFELDKKAAELAEKTFAEDWTEDPEQVRPHRGPRATPLSSAVSPHRPVYAQSGAVEERPEAIHIRSPGYLAVRCHEGR
jgi:hypothetical protein